MDSLSEQSLDAKLLRSRRTKVKNAITGGIVVLALLGLAQIVILNDGLPQNQYLIFYVASTAVIIYYARRLPRARPKAKMSSDTGFLDINDVTRPDPSGVVGSANAALEINDVNPARDVAQSLFRLEKLNNHFRSENLLLNQRRLDPALGDAIKEIRELFSRLNRSGEKQLWQLALDRYADLLCKLEKVLSGTLIYDLAFNPRYVSDVERRSAQILEAVDSLRNQAILNIRQLNEHTDFDFQLILATFQNLGSDDQSKLYKK
jgi:hypothetical protein